MRKLPWILLALSILFNFTFTTGFMQARSRSETARQPRGASDLMAERLDLTGAQREELGRLRQDYEGSLEELRQAVILARQELWSAYSRPSETDAIRSAESNLFELYRDFRQTRLTQFGHFMKLLNPDQRRHFMGMMRHQEFRGPVGRHLLGRFDANGDGVLDESERAKAREAMRTRFGGMRDRRGPDTRPGANNRPPYQGQFERNRNSRQTDNESGNPDAHHPR